MILKAFERPLKDFERPLEGHRKEKSYRREILSEVTVLEAQGGFLAASDSDCLVKSHKNPSYLVKGLLKAFSRPLKGL